jgi:hypothetical protein
MAAAANVTVEWTYPAQEGINSAISTANDGDVLIFPDRVFIFTAAVEVPVDKTLDFCGASTGGTTLMADPNVAKCYLFNVLSNSWGNMEGIENLTFTGASGSGSLGGGTVFCWNVRGGISDCKFIRNAAKDENDGGGGGICCYKFFSGGIRNSNFVSNQADNGVGGAIFCGKLISDVNNSKFLSNWATSGGGIGAIIFGGENTAFADLGGSYFLENYAEQYGGAIFLFQNAYLCALSGDVVFQGNKSHVTGENALHICATNNYDDFFVQSDWRDRLVSESGSDSSSSSDETILFAIGAAEGRTFWNYDPISGNFDTSENFFPALTVQINPDSSQTGTVLFNRYHSDIWFESSADVPGGATVSYGTMVLQNGASFGAGIDNFGRNQHANSGTFTLEKPATLRIVYGQNIEVYDYYYDSSTFEVTSTTKAMPYDSNEMRSEIWAGNTILMGKLQFVLPPNVTEDVPMLSIPQGDVSIGADATIDVGVNDCTATSFSLREGQPVILLDCGGLLTCEKTSFPDCDGGTIPGVRSDYQFHIQRRAHQILATYLGSGSSSSSGSGINARRTKVLGEGWLVGITLLNGGGDLVDLPLLKNVTTFCAFDGNFEWCKTDPQLKLHGASLEVGVADGTGPLTYGLLFEGIFAGSNTKDSWEDTAEITGKGRGRAIGGSAFGVLTFGQDGLNYPRLEVAVRAGRFQNRWAIDDNLDGGHKWSINLSAPYVGIRMGAAHGLLIREQFPLDFYGKLFWSHIFGEEFNGGKVFFRYLNSFRLRLGSRFTYQSNRKLIPWCGAYYEQELAGVTEGTAEGLKISRSTLKGGCAAGELGFSYQPSPKVAVSFSFHGSVGKQKSISAFLNANYEF